MSTFSEDAENVYNRDQLLKTYAMLDANSATAKMLWEEVGRLSSIIDINTTLSALSKGRLLADNETPFTAEQVEDVEALVAAANPYSAPAARLRALFSATEPAEHVHEQGAHYTKGHTKAGAWTVSTCRTCGAVIERGSDDGAWVENTDPPAPAEPAEEETKAEDEARIWGINTPEPSDVQYLRDRFGNLFKRFAPDTWRRWRPAAERFGDADWTWVELAINLPTPVLGVPHELAAAEPVDKKGEPEAIEALTEAIRFTVEYVGTEILPPIEGWDWYDALTKYAPDKAKAFLDAYAPPAETPVLVTELAKSIMNRAYDSDDAWDRERSDRPRFEHYAKFALSYLASSPVVPAPTETEWATVVEIPVGAAFRPAGYTGPSYIIKTALGYRITPNGDHRLWNGAPVGTLAPFVAAEEG